MNVYRGKKKKKKDEKKKKKKALLLRALCVWKGPDLPGEQGLAGI